MQYKAINLSAINASGTSPKALYSALTTNMFFGQLSPLEIRVDKGIVKPYLSVSLPELDALTQQTKKTLLLESCLQQTAKQLQLMSIAMPINTIEQVIIVSSMLNSDQEQSDIEQEKNDWQQTVIQQFEDQLTVLSNKLSFVYLDDILPDNSIANNIKADSFQRPILMIHIDSLCDYHSVKTLNTLVDIQCHQGSTGVMPSEAITSTLLIPNNYPEFTHEKMITVEPLNNGSNSIKAQLTQSEFSIPNHVLHVGTVSEAWVAHWYAQTNSFYHQNNNVETQQTNDNTIMVYNQTNVLGYIGAANFTTALASVAALLNSPLEQAATIWLVEHNVNSKNSQQQVANVYKISKI